MTLHEAMHAYAGYWLGDDTAKQQGRLTLNPLRHIDPFLTVLLPVVLALSGAPIFGAAKPVPFNPNRVKYDEFGAALVGLAGPLTNFVFALAAAGLVKVFMPAGVTLDVLIIFIQVNVGFFVFNMIPFPPLDGSRLLYAFAPEPLQRVMQQIESFGITSIVIFMFLLFPALSPIIGNIMDSLLRFLLA
jgi:Zn-dependent protease